MSQSPNESRPDGADEAQQVEAGEPADLETDEARDLPARPDLDRRQRNISTLRKPMGPPPSRSGPLADASSADDAEPPTDPS
jgi:hypothetical protein